MKDEQACGETNSDAYKRRAELKCSIMNTIGYSRCRPLASQMHLIGGNRLAVSFTPDEYIVMIQLPEYKVGTAECLSLLSKAVIVKPDDVRTRSLVIAGLRTVEEAKNLCEYLKTDFVRYLVGQTKLDNVLSAGNFTHAPILDFAERWDDAKLNEFYSFTEEQKDVIKDVDSLIKEVVGAI